MTEEQFNSKYLREMRDLNSNLMAIATELGAIVEALNRIAPPPVTLQYSVKEVKSDE